MPLVMSASDDENLLEEPLPEQESPTSRNLRERHEQIEYLFLTVQSGDGDEALLQEHLEETSSSSRLTEMEQLAIISQTNDDDIQKIKETIDAALPRCWSCGHQGHVYAHCHPKNPKIDSDQTPSTDATKSGNPQQEKKIGAESEDRYAPTGEHLDMTIHELRTESKRLEARLKEAYLLNSDAIGKATMIQYHQVRREIGKRPEDDPDDFQRSSTWIFNTAAPTDIFAHLSEADLRAKMATLTTRFDAAMMYGTEAEVRKAFIPLRRIQQCLTERENASHDPAILRPKTTRPQDLLKMTLRELYVERDRRHLILNTFIQDRDARAANMALIQYHAVQAMIHHRGGLDDGYILISKYDGRQVFPPGSEVPNKRGPRKKTGDTTIDAMSTTQVHHHIRKLTKEIDLAVWFHETTKAEHKMCERAGYIAAIGNCTVPKGIDDPQGTSN